jgi:ABC-type phosphate/phosphonate transport system substrate-binding protein
MTKWLASRWRVDVKAQRYNVRFAIPSSLGSESGKYAQQLQAHLATALGRETEVVLASTYEQLARELLSGKVDADGRLTDRAGDASVFEQHFR